MFQKDSNWKCIYSANQFGATNLSDGISDIVISGKISSLELFQSTTTFPLSVHTIAALLHHLNLSCGKITVCTCQQFLATEDKARLCSEWSHYPKLKSFLLIFTIIKNSGYIFIINFCLRFTMFLICESFRPTTVQVCLSWQSDWLWFDGDNAFSQQNSFEVRFKFHRGVNWITLVYAVCCCWWCYKSLTE